MARVLILEDSDDYRNLLRRQLESEGFEVAAASNGTSALQLLARQPADVVLTDLFMPDKDGLETILEIRARYPRASIVAMSGWQSKIGPDYLKVAREVGAVRTLRKPFPVEELVRLVSELAGDAAR